jgi:hypothetical protein
MMGEEIIEELLKDSISLSLADLRRLLRKKGYKRPANFIRGYIARLEREGKVKLGNVGPCITLTWVG